MGCTFVDVCKQEHLFEKVKVVIRSNTVRTQRNIDTTLEHFRYARKAARKLHIADRAGRNGHAAALQNGKVTVIQPDTVRCRGRLIEQTQLFKICCGRHAVTCLALFVLALGLGQVNVHACIDLLGMLCDSFDHLGRSCVLAVNAQVNLQSAIACVLITRKQVAIVLVGGSLLVVAVIKDGQSTAQVALDAGFQNGIGHSLAEKVHVSKRYRTKAQHFGNGQTGCRCDSCVAELVLKRENTLVQPALQ